MGVSSSKSAIDVINEAVANVIVKSLLACSGKVVQQQSIRLSGNVSDTTIKQTAVVEIRCLQNLQLTADLQTKIANAIKQASEAESIPLSGTYAESLSAIKNYVGTNLNISNIANCSASVNNRQEVIVDPGSNIKRVSLVQNANVVANCMQKALNNLKFAQGLVSTVENKSATRGSPVVAIVVILVVIILICGGGVFAYFYVENKKDERKHGPQMSRQYQPSSMMSSVAQSVGQSTSRNDPTNNKKNQKSGLPSTNKSPLTKELEERKKNLKPYIPDAPPLPPPTGWRNDNKLNPVNIVDKKINLPSPQAPEPEAAPETAPETAREEEMKRDKEAQLMKESVIVADERIKNLSEDTAQEKKRPLDEIYATLSDSNNNASGQSPANIHKIITCNSIEEVQNDHINKKIDINNNVLLITDVDGTLTNHAEPSKLNENEASHPRDGIMNMIPYYKKRGCNIIAASAWDHFGPGKRPSMPKDVGTLGRIQQIGLADIFNINTSIKTTHEDGNISYNICGYVISARNKNTNNPYYGEKALTPYYHPEIKDKLEKGIIKTVIFMDDSEGRTSDFNNHIIKYNLYKGCNVYIYYVSLPKH